MVNADNLTKRTKILELSIEHLITFIKNCTVKNKKTNIRDQNVVFISQNMKVKAKLFVFCVLSV